jgi:hypothetical protein
MSSNVQSTTLKLLDYCRRNNWAGYEPYDALNSRILQALPFLDVKLPRLAITQFLKRSPINTRALLQIPKTQNPKALGLFLSSLVNLSRAGITEYEDLEETLIENLIALRSPGAKHWCWGYNFPWQTRTVIVPRWRPNLVCTTFAATGLLDVYGKDPKPEYLEMAVSSAEYLLEDLYWTLGDSVCGFGYPLPEVHSQVHNANLLGAALFCRIYSLTGEKKFLEPALALSRYSVNQQHVDGGWDYGEAPHQKWIDNFHTGFNLSALRQISLSLATTEFEASIERGFKFYKKHFFREDGAVGYFHDRFYPIDSHCVAQSIITLLDLSYLDSGNAKLSHKILAWAEKRLWDEKEGYFYYRMLPWCTIRTSYMRWTQAWMLLSLTMLLAEDAQAAKVAADSKNVAEVGSC